ncbi:MAG: DinB family protein [Bacteroidota bacterium]
MKAFFEDLHNYHHILNQKVINLFIKNRENISEKSTNWLCHSLNAHQIWNARIMQEQPMGVFQVHTLEKCLDIDKTNFRNSQHILDNYALDAVIGFHDSKGNPYENILKDILFHITNHFTHHRAQIMSDLRNNGIKPLRTDFIYYKRDKLFQP